MMIKIQTCGEAEMATFPSARDALIYRVLIDGGCLDDPDVC